MFFSLSSSSPFYSFQAHTANVCHLSLSNLSTILSCGWDDTAKVFKEGKQILSFKHANLGIWALLQIPSHYVTIGANKSIVL